MKKSIVKEYIDVVKCEFTDKLIDIWKQLNMLNEIIEKLSLDNVALKQQVKQLSCKHTEKTFIFNSKQKISVCDLCGDTQDIKIESKEEKK